MSLIRWRFYVSAVPEPPTHVRFTNVTEDSAIIVWVVPRSRITGYRVVLSEGDSPVRQHNLPAHLSQYSLLNLRPNTMYTATLRTEKGNLFSEGTTGIFTTCESLYTLDLSPRILCFRIHY